MTTFDIGDCLDLEQDLDQAHLLRLCGIGDRQCYSRNQYIYHQGDHAGSVYILMSGTVKATCSDENGNETLLKVHRSGSLLGLSALRPIPRRDANGIALESSEVTHFTKDDFFAQLRGDGELGVLLVRVLLKRQQQLHFRMAEVAGHSVKQRVARTLLQLHAEAGTRAPGPAALEIPISHEDLATLVLSRRQYVTAILRSFVSEGLIENRRCKICIFDTKGLERVVYGQ